MLGMLGGAKWIVVGLAALAITTIIGLAYRHYTGLIDDKVTAEANAAKLELALETQKATTAALRENVAEWQAAAERYQQAAHEAQLTAKHAQAETRKLNALFSKHDFTNLARRKPGLIERRVNAGTVRAGELLECLTTPGGGCGSDRDRAATGASTDPPPSPSADAGDQVGGSDPGEHTAE